MPVSQKDLGINSKVVLKLITNSVYGLDLAQDRDQDQCRLL